MRVFPYLAGALAVLPFLLTAEAWASGPPRIGPEFQVNTFTPGSQANPSVGFAQSGDFVVTWTDDGQGGSFHGVFARRFDSAGNALDPAEFQVNTYTTDSQSSPSVGVTPSGDFVVAWQSYSQDGSTLGIFARRFDSAGNPLDPAEFQVNTYTPGAQYGPSVSVAPSGSFVVRWTSADPGHSSDGVFAKRFESTGNALDAVEFQVNTYTTGNQRFPSASVADSGDFVVTWLSVEQDGSYLGVFAQLFGSDSDGDGLRDAEDVLVMTPLAGGSLDCRTPTDPATRPFITWSPGNYDRFRVQISWNPSFPKKQRITSGDDLLTRTEWKLGAKAWRHACRKAESELHIRVFGLDRDVGNTDPHRRTFSDAVTTGLIR